jgi:arylsulfatase A-like enzyme
MKNKLMIFAGSMSCMTVCAATEQEEKNDSPEKPNIIVILADDQGYADVGCYGAHGFKTPNADRMAKEGMKFTDFYVASGLSTPSRAALLTGCYPVRIDMDQVLFPDAKRGINPEEATIAEILRESGYSTACIGKWHLGHLKPALPLQHGFDEFFGLPYSNDMIPLVYPGQYVPNNQDRAEYPDLPLMQGNDVIEYNPLQKNLTTRYTEYAVSYIKRKKDEPFFLYFAHSMPHVPLAVSDKFKGKSHQGVYGDVIMEIDWSIGEIYKALKENNIADNTLVIYTSDNGPWLQMGNHGGSADPLYLGKGNTFDGGQRVFCLMTWPRVIPAGSVCSEPVSAIDFLPTFAHVAGGKLSGNKIDGMNIYPLLAAETNVASPHEAIYFYGGSVPHAIRVGNWKYHEKHPFWQTIIPGKDGFRGSAQKYITQPALYNLSEDIGEQDNLIEKHPELAEKMRKMLFDFDKDLNATKRKSAVYGNEDLTI